MLLAEVFYFEVCDSAAEYTGFLKWEYQCAYIIHLILSIFVMVYSLLVKCLYQFSVDIKACLFLVAAYLDVCLLTGIELEIEGV